VILLRSRQFPDKAEFVTDVHPKNRPSSYNPVMEKWFNYSYLANVLVPKPLVYLVRTHDGKYAKVHILSTIAPTRVPAA